MKFLLLNTLLLMSFVSNATILTWDLTDPDSMVKATFVYDDASLDGVADNGDLISITTDIITGIMFTYEFGGNAGTENKLLYDIDTLNLTRYENGAVVTSTNIGDYGALTFQHINYDMASFTFRDADVYLTADWNGVVVTMDEDTCLGGSHCNVSAVSEPSTFAIFALGLMCLATRRFKKQS